MATPKKKISKTRGRTRRAHYKVTSRSGLAKCSNCKTLIMPHRVCSLCGHYKGKLVVEVA